VFNVLSPTILQNKVWNKIMIFFGEVASKIGDLDS